MHRMMARPETIERAIETAKRTGVPGQRPEGQSVEQWEMHHKRVVQSLEVKLREAKGAE